MFPFDQAALPQLTTRRAFIGVDFQNDFTASDGAMCAMEPPNYVQRAAELASVFREQGDVVWVKSRFEKKRISDAEQIIVTDPTPNLGSRASGGVRYTRRRGTPATEGLIEPAGPLDPEAFLSHDEPWCLKNSSPSACDWAPEIKTSMQKGDVTLTKSHYSAFNDTQLLHILRAKMVMEVFICGSLANVGVYATAMDAAGHGLSITIIEDCCGYRHEVRQRQAIKSLIEFTGCEVASFKEVLGTIKPSQPKAKAPEKRTSTQSAKTSAEDGGRASCSPDILRPMNGLRLVSDSPSPTNANLASSAGMSSEAESQAKPREATGTTSDSAPAPESNLTQKDKKDETEAKLSTPVQAEEESRQKSTASPIDVPPKDMATSDQNSDGDGEFRPQRGLCEGDTDVIEDLLPRELADDIFEKLRDEVQWKRMSHQGGEVPRLVAVQGEVADDGSIPVYRHPADESPPLFPFSHTVLAIKAAAEKCLGHPLNHALIQYYRSGKDYISEHSDKTLDIVKDSYIANVSVGAERTMVLRTKRLDKDLSLPGTPSPEDLKRRVQRARLPHNSLCRMGLRTNMKWLHSIRQDKRAEREKTTAELAFSGGRISLTFRHIGTFLDRNETIIWGQGAKGKTRKEANPIVNGTGLEAIEMLKAFGVENHSSIFDWDTQYGQGFDVLHMSNSPRLFSSPDPQVNMRIALMLAELGINYAKGSMGPAVSKDSAEDTVEPVPIKFVDNDASKSTVHGDVAIMMYLDAVYGRAKEGDKANRDQASLAKIYSRFQQALDFSGLLKRLQRNTVNVEVELKTIRQELAVWDRYAAEVDGGYLAGSKPLLPDFVIWPALHAVVGKYGNDLFEGADSLSKYYEAYGDRDSSRKVLSKAPL